MPGSELLGLLYFFGVEFRKLDGPEGLLEIGEADRWLDFSVPVGLDYFFPIGLNF